MKTISSVILAVIFLSQNVQVFGITGGESAKEGEFPFMVSIRSGPSHGNCHFCSGTIINERWILTSNPCYSSSFGSTISFGSIKNSVPVNYTCDPYNSTIQRNIDDALYNPFAISRPPYTYDMVLVHLNESIPFSENVQPVTLPDGDEPWPDGKIGTILGWGTHDDSYPLQIQVNLQKAQVPLFSEKYCANNSLWGNWELADPTVMKCGGEINKTYYCRQDYGGPLLVDGKQYGIISYARTDPDGPCGQYLGIFSPVTYFRDWIRDTTGV